MTNTSQLAPTQPIEEKSYDTIPYGSQSIAYTHPARMAAVAYLFGLTPPNVETARVLELGCAAGGNLIPLAHGYPQARFVGVDISGVQVAEGHTHVAELGLSNIELLKMNIGDIGADIGQFDYIICHGVYSWVPEPVRDAIMRVCHENLTAQGVAFVSYNALPFWHLLQPLRDLLIHHTAALEPQLRAQSARTLIQDLTQLPAGLGADILRNEARLLASQPDFYLIHEYLEDINHASYFKDFVTHAHTQRLAYLSDVNVGWTLPETFGSQGAELAYRHGAGDLQQTEQYADFIFGRRFRQTLLVKRDNGERIRRVLSVDCLDQLHFLCCSKISKQIASTISTPMRQAAQPEVWFRRADEAVVVTPESRLATRALEYLAESPTAHLSTFTVDELVQHSAQSSTWTSEEKSEVAEWLLDMLLQNHVEIYFAPIRSQMLSDKPNASSLARSDQAHGRRFTANALHGTYSFDEGDKLLLPFLDGTHDCAALEAVVHAAFKAGALSLSYKGQALNMNDDAASAVREYVQAHLQRLESARMLS